MTSVTSRSTVHPEHRLVRQTRVNGTSETTSSSLSHSFRHSLLGRTSVPIFDLRVDRSSIAAVRDGATGDAAAAEHPRTAQLLAAGGPQHLRHLHV